MSRDTLSLVDGEDGKTAYCPAFMSDRKALPRHRRDSKPGFIEISRAVTREAPAVGGTATGANERNGEKSFDVRLLKRRCWLHYCCLVMPKATSHSDCSRNDDCASKQDRRRSLWSSFGQFNHD